MQLKKTLKKTSKLFIACLTSFILLLLSAAYLQTGAISENVEEVISTLETMVKVDINPAWLPDIRANEKSVESMYNAYLACSAEERLEFSQEQNELLEEYFVALFKVQGKDTAIVSDLFAEKPALEPSPSASPQATATPAPTPTATPAPTPTPEATATLTPPATLTPTAEPTLAPTAEPTLAPTAEPTLAPTAEPTAQPVQTPVPQKPESGAAAAVYRFFSNGTVGLLMVIVLGILLLVVLLRFFAAIRKVQPTDDEAGIDKMEKELFGQSGMPPLDSKPEEKLEDKLAAARRRQAVKAGKAKPKKTRKKKESVETEENSKTIIAEISDDEIDIVSEFETLPKSGTEPVDIIDAEIIEEDDMADKTDVYSFAKLIQSEMGIQAGKPESEEKITADGVQAKDETPAAAAPSEKEAGTQSVQKASEETQEGGAGSARPPKQPSPRSLRTRPQEGRFAAPCAGRSEGADVDEPPAFRLPKQSFSRDDEDI